MHLDETTHSQTACEASARARQAMWAQQGQHVIRPKTVMGQAKRPHTRLTCGQVPRWTCQQVCVASVAHVTSEPIQSIILGPLYL